MPVTTARKAFTLGGCRRTHDVTTPSGRFAPLISSPLGRLAFAPPPPPVEEHGSVFFFLIIFFLIIYFLFLSLAALSCFGGATDRSGRSYGWLRWRPFAVLGEAGGVNVRPVRAVQLCYWSTSICPFYYTFYLVITNFTFHGNYVQIIDYIPFLLYFLSTHHKFYLPW